MGLKKKFKEIAKDKISVEVLESPIGRIGGEWAFNFFF
jgi:hypothetical protein